MSVGLLLLALVAAVNPARLALALPDGRPRARVALLGGAIALAGASALVLAGDAVLAALDVSAESFRLAVGLVLGLEGARSLVVPRPAREPVLAGYWSALVPVAFPLLLSPSLTVLALGAGAGEPAAEALGAVAAVVPLAVAVGVLVALAGVHDV